MVSTLTSNSPTTIAIVGAGFSGSLVAAHLLKTATRPLIIKLIERSQEIGKGIAYGTQTTGHLLNVSAGKMSAFPDDPTHLLRWLNYNQDALIPFLASNFNASSFIPRRVFGLYIQSILEEAEATAASNVRLERVIDEVVAVEPIEKRAVVSLRSGKIFEADKIILAVGNAPSSISESERNDQPYLYNAWSIDALEGLDRDDPVLLIGTGLTMVDMIVSLNERKHRGKIYAVSRRGLFPLTHQSAKVYPPFLTAETTPKTVRLLFQRIRREVETATLQGYDWRAVIDSLRPITQQIWQHLPRLEQQRMLRHAAPYWDVHRHRIAPEIGQIVQNFLVSGQLETFAGRIRRYEVSGDRVAVTIQLRKTNDKKVLEVSRILSCTGINIDYRRSQQVLIKNLREQGLIRPNNLGLGLDTTTEGILLDQQGHPSHFLYTLGTPRKGDLWETIAVPELRGQAQALAETILHSLPLRILAIASLFRDSQKEIKTTTVAFSTLLFRQFFDPESSTYTYLIADSQSKEAVLVDTVLEQVDRDLQVLEDLGLTLRYCLETHIHADHITGAGKLRQQTGCQVIVPQNATAKSANHSLADGEILQVGSVEIEAIATPGHTNSHLAYWVNKTHLLTGDALLIRGCGRTDFQSGDAGTLYDTVMQRLFTLPEEILVYPAHDYQGRTVSTIGEEKRLNPRLSERSREQFITLMNHLGLSYPKKMDQALPANEYCGDFISEVDQGEKEDLAIAANREKIEQSLSTNTEIYDDYFAMYI